MRVVRTAPAAFIAELESEEELRDEHRLNLSQGGLRLVTAETAPLYASLVVTLRGPWGGEAAVRATVVAFLPDGLALAIEGYGDEQLERLLVRPREEPPAEVPAAPASASESEEAESPERTQNVWDRIRGLTQMEKLLLAVKADRTERALLLQDNDPRVLLSLLRNPRLTVEEVTRLARSSFLTYPIADVIAKSPQWMASLDVRVALVHNPKTPPALALRILPTLPVAEVRAVARAGTNMQLKTAALRRLAEKG